MKAFTPLYKSKDEIDTKYNDVLYLETKTDQMHNNLKNYFGYPNTLLDERKRLILFTWLMEFSSDLGFKRNTYHNAAYLIDMYLSLTVNAAEIKIEDIQLIGVVCLMISVKNEETTLPPPVILYQNATANSCSVERILLYEEIILKKLKWKIQYPNLSVWGNYTMEKWDSFAKSGYNGAILPLFRDDPKYEYNLLKNFFLLIDAISLDYYHISFHEKLICLSVIYLLIGLSLNCIDMNEDILKGFENKVCNQNFYSFNEMFNVFTKKEFNISIELLGDTIKYSCIFFNIKFEYKDPNFNGVTKEETVQTQTMNSKIFSSMEKIFLMRENNNNCSTESCDEIMN